MLYDFFSNFSRFSLMKNKFGHFNLKSNLNILKCKFDESFIQSQDLKAKLFFNLINEISQQSLKSLVMLIIMIINGSINISSFN